MLVASVFKSVAYGFHKLISLQKSVLRKYDNFCTYSGNKESTVQGPRRKPPQLKAVQHAGGFHCFPLYLQLAAISGTEAVVE